MENIKSTSGIDEELYFGDKYTFMYPCTGIFRSYKTEYIQQPDISPESISETCKYANDLSYIKPEYKDYYVPCIPETQIRLINKNISENENEKTELFLSEHPLIKSKKIENLIPFYKVIVSGHRSAIIKDEKTRNFYRLKGCGNDEIGFNLLKGEGFFKEFNTRGSQYDCTCSRELFFSEKVNKCLEKDGFLCANIPIGFWKYDKNLYILSNDKIDNENIPKLENAVPEIEKYCGIYKTLGDKRLRTHLLCGIEFILKIIAKNMVSKGKFNDNNLNEMRTVFPVKRLPDKIETYKTIEFFNVPKIDGKILTVEEWCKNPIYKKEYYDRLVLNDKLQKCIKENPSLKLFIEYCDKVDKFKGILPLLTENLSENHKNKMVSIFNKILSKLDNNSFFETLLKLYIRVGYEAGKIKKCMQNANINWGSFIDHGPYNFHCNAHSNNFVILPQGYNSLLAVLDLDLAFSKEKMVNIYKESDTFGKHDESFWENYIHSEFIDLSMNLCGSEDYNFSFGKEEKKDNSIEEKIRDTIKYLLCDSMLESYMKGFDGIESENVIKSSEIKNNDFLHEIIKMAMVVTSSHIA